jgi:hypothetical protein
LSSENNLVSKAKTPEFAGLDRLNEWMLVNLPVCPSVMVLRLVAAAHRTALQTGAQVHPHITHRYALVADIGLWLGGRRQLLDVMARWTRHIWPTP